jgi:hypothetical protein
MIGRRKPVSDDDDMRSETVRLGRDSESDKVSVLWKARWMVVLVEVAGIYRKSNDPALCRRLLQDTRDKRLAEMLAPEVENSNRYALF